MCATLNGEMPGSEKPKSKPSRNMTDAEEIQQFKNEQREALISMDEQKIRAFAAKWNGTQMPTNMEMFWCSVHKAITGLRTFPIGRRRESKAWLDERGWKSWGDSEL